MASWPWAASCSSASPEAPGTLERPHDAEALGILEQPRAVVALGILGLFHATVALGMACILVRLYAVVVLGIPV